MLKVESLNVAYGDLQVLFDVNLHVEKNSIIALVGANAAGKTTFLNSVCGIVPAMSGKVTFDGVDISNKSVYERVNAGIAHVPEGRHLFPFMTVEENLEMGAYSLKSKEEEKRNMEYAYSLFPKLKERRKQLAGSLSGGEQQMVAIARGLMSSPKLIIFDEPSLGLAPIIVQEIFHTIVSLKDTGATILLIEQNVQRCLEIADYGYVMENGQITLEGKGKELLANEHLKKAYLGI